MRTRQIRYISVSYTHLDVYKRQVIIPISGFPPMLATRNLLYTAITRGKKLVILVGSEERMQRMIDNNRIDERYTGLEDRLREIDLGRGLT